MNDCGCCTGIEPATPTPVDNRPGLDAIAYRVGTHGRFLDSMLARLSSPAYPELAALRARTPDDLAIALLDSWASVADILTFYTERIANEGYLRTATEPESITRLGRLVGFTPRPGLGASVFLAYTLLTDPARDTTVTIPRGARAQSVPGPGQLPQTYETTADLDCRATWNDLRVRPSTQVLITSETVAELSELHLAGTDTQVKPGDRLLLVFATGTPRLLLVASVAKDLTASRTTVTMQNGVLQKHFNDANRRLNSAVDAFVKSLPRGNIAAARFLDYLRSLPSLFPEPGAERDDPEPEELLEELIPIQGAIEEELALATFKGDTTIIDLVTPLREPVADARRAAEQLLAATGGPTDVPSANSKDPAPAITALGTILGALRRPASRPPANPFALGRSPATRFAPGSDAAAQLLVAADPRLTDNLYGAWSNQQIGNPSPLRSVQHLRITAAPFGATAPDQPPAANSVPWPLNETPTQLSLDAVYDGIVAGSWVIIERTSGPLSGTGIIFAPRETAPISTIATATSTGTAADVTPTTAAVTTPATTINYPVITRVGAVDTIARRDYGITGRVTQLTLLDPWLPADTVSSSLHLSDIRPVTVRVLSVALPQAPAPITDDVAGDTIDLDGLYQGLHPGRWLVVSGERTDIPGTSGVTASELVMLAGVDQIADPSLPGETPHAQLKLTTSLGFTYRRDSVHIAGNVAPATQGEARTQVLGSGDGGKAGQAFTLTQSPLTWLPATTASGAADTLEVRVDGVRWHPVDTLADAGPADRVYALRTGADGRYSVVFGDGLHGARLPTGVENVTATYRIGLGRSGDVNAGQVSQLATRPQGVLAVTNPLRASGGVDPDDTGLARRTTPLRMLALDRLVSVADYEDFARARAGIGTATATKLTDGRRQVVHLTVAGVDDIPLDDTSALLVALRAAVAVNGDPHQPVQVAVRALVLLILGAGIHVDPDYQWTQVAPAVRAALLDRFGARRAELGRPVYLSDVMATVQAVAGVDYLEVDTFTGVPGDATPATLATLGATLRREEFVAARLARRDETTYLVKADTLTSVAAAHDLTVPELLALNPGLTNVDLHAVKELVVRRGVLPAELVRFDPGVPDTIALHEVLP